MRGDALRAGMLGFYPASSASVIDAADTQQQAAIVVIAVALLVVAPSEMAAPYPLRPVLDAAVAFCAEKKIGAVWRPLLPQPSSWIATYADMLRYLARPHKITVETYEGQVAGRRLSAVVTDINPGNETCEVFEPLADSGIMAKDVIEWAGRVPNERPYLDEPGRVRVRWRPGITPGALFAEVTIFEPDALPKGPPYRPGLRYSAERPKH